MASHAKGPGTAPRHHNKVIQNSYRQKTTSYSNVKYSPRAPLILLTVEKIEHENFDFVFLVSFLVFFFYFKHISEKLYGVYKQPAHQTTALLSQMLLSGLKLHVS